MLKQISKFKKWGIASLFLLLTATLALANNPPQPTVTQGKISAANAVILSQYHYERIPFDNTLSLRIYDSYLRALDPQKVYFLQEDVLEFNEHVLLFDDYLIRSDLTVPFQMYERLMLRMKERYDYAKILLNEHDFNFDTSATIVIDRKDQPFAKNRAELDQIWQGRIQNELINILVADEEKALEEAKERLLKRYQARRSRIDQNTSEDIFDLYMNVVSASYDPHSSYFSAKQMENFNINMSLSLEGIGTVLRQDEDSVKIMEIVPGGPADLTKQIAVSDEVIGVAQGDEGEFVDIVGMRLDKVVEMVRGEKGTVVRLQMLGNRGKGPEKIVRIVRDRVKLDKQAAKSDRFTVPAPKEGVEYSIGVITLPTFYSDFEANKKGEKDYRSTTRDVKRLVQKMLDEEPLDGLIIDLRDNGGGSLQEVIDLSALFLPEQKTIVQTRSFDGSIEEQKSRKERQIYSGPMIVMVNRLSASASEIFAGSMQDQGRALIVGGTTFGKGTVQTVINLEALLSKRDKPGQTKVTIAKFYRANGESTQEKGVVPDIMLPSFYDTAELGEATEHYVLPWDQIRAAKDYDEANRIGEDLIENLVKRSAKRFKKERKLKILTRQIAAVNALWKRERLSLNLEERRKELQEKEQQNLKWQNELREIYGFEPLTLEEFRNEDGLYTEMLEESETDVLLDEAMAILADYIVALEAQEDSVKE